MDSGRLSTWDRLGAEKSERSVESRALMASAGEISMKPRSRFSRTR
jgi:hypothetical protein